jgi:hypothetical protein
MKSMKGTTMQSDDTLDIASKGLMSIYSQFELGIKADGFLGIKTDYLSAQSSTAINLVGTTILLNSGPPTIVSTPDGITEYILPDTTFDSSTGWQVDPTALRSIVSRAPTHEPYPYHNQGVKLNISLEEGKPSSMPNAPQMPSGWSITKE